MTAADRLSRAAAHARTAGLTADLDHWLDLTRAGAAFPQHHTQVRAVDAALRPLLAELPDTDPLHADRQLALLQQAWCRLREALTQRHDASLQPFLALADDFAWSCYSPALAAARSALPSVPPPVEPPLVLLTAHGAPYALPRRPADPDGARITRILQELPVPLVSLPLFHARHLPEAVLSAHEVGHCVMEAFGLFDELAALLRRTATEPESWVQRLPEVFADLYGVLRGGTGFALALAEFVALTPPGPSTDYPAPHLRVALAADALTAAGLPHRAEQVRAAWDTRPGAEPAPTGLATTVRHLLTTELTGLGGRSLLALPPPPPDDLLQATADALLTEDELPGAEATAELLIPATALAFHTDPARWTVHATDITERVHRRATDHRDLGIRGGPPVDTEPPETAGARAATRLRALLTAE